MGDDLVLVVEEAGDGWWRGASRTPLVGRFVDHGQRCVGERFGPLWLVELEGWIKDPTLTVVTNLLLVWAEDSEPREGYVGFALPVSAVEPWVANERGSLDRDSVRSGIKARVEIRRPILGPQ